jgi:hypothetical protein
MMHLVVAKAIAAVSFAAIVFAGGLLHRKLGARAQAEEVEALLAAEFARLEEAQRPAQCPKCPNRSPAVVPSPTAPM